MKTKRVYPSSDRSKGIDYDNFVNNPRGNKKPVKVKRIVTPNASMSLAEILERFTRDESLPISKRVSWLDNGTDLEKLANADLVDQALFVEKMKDIKNRYHEEQVKIQAKEREKIRLEEIEKIRLEEIQRREKLGQRMPDPNTPVE